MRPLSKSLILITLLVCAGCAKPSDISVARRDHILAGPHGWIDVTLHAPTSASAPAAGAASATKVAASAAGTSPECGLVLAVNGEILLLESANLGQADAARSPIGYRFVVPVGTLDTRLSILHCVQQEVVLDLPVVMEKNHVAWLEFDGQHLALRSTAAYEPVTLEAVRGDVAKLQEHGDATDGKLSSLTKLALASAILNAGVVVALLVLVIRRRNC